MRARAEEKGLAFTAEWGADLPATMRRAQQDSQAVVLVVFCDTCFGMEVGDSTLQKVTAANRLLIDVRPINSSSRLAACGDETTIKSGPSRTASAIRAKSGPSSNAMHGNRTGVIPRSRKSFSSSSASSTALVTSTRNLGTPSGDTLRGHLPGTP